jgi:hypothetical protein
MKRILTVFLFMTIPMVFTFGQKQYTPPDIITIPHIYLYGLDFTFTQIFGERPINTKYLRDTLFGVFSDRFIKEAPDLFRRRYEKEITVIQKPFVKPVSQELVPYLDSTTMAGFIRNYPLKETEGIGLVLLVKRMDKHFHRTDGAGVFFDIASRKPLKIYTLNGKAGGFGLDGYWWTSIEAMYSRLSWKILYNPY